MFKKHKLVLVPTNEKTTKLKSNRTHLIVQDSKLFNPFKNEYYDLHVLSDDEIVKGDFRMMVDKSSVLYGQVEKHLGNHECNDQWKKVIATTDSNLKINKFESGVFKDLQYSLPQIPVEFVQHFIEQYKQGIVLESVEFEYEEITDIEVKYKYPYGDIANHVGTGEFKVKLNKENTININLKPTKTSWNRNEVDELLDSFEQLCYNYQNNKDWFPAKKQEWIAKNL